MSNEQPVTVREAAEELGLSPATIRAWIRRRKIGYVRLGRAVRIPASEMRRIVERGTVHAVPQEAHEEDR
jgi:excisionase family DNA binding protein